MSLLTFPRGVEENQKFGPMGFSLKTVRYNCVFCTLRYMCMYHYNTFGFLLGSLDVLSRHLDPHPSTPHAVCVCVRTHTHSKNTH